MRWRGASACATALLVASACGDGGPTGPGASVSISGPDRLELVAGDTAHLSATVSEPGVPVTWSSTSKVFATVSSGSVVGLRPGTTLIIATAAGGAADTVQVTVVPRPDGYTSDEVDYFAEIALGFEYGSASPVVRRWGGPIRFRVNGAPDDADRATLAAVVEEVNALTRLVDMVEVTEDPVVEIHFAPVSAFPGILPSYVPGNVGYFSVWFDGTHHFTRAVVLISTDHEQRIQDHLIREEVTQILGLGRDSNRYPSSIFYQQWSLVTEYAPVDRALIEMLYRPEVRPGMEEAQVSAVLRRLTRGVVAAAPALAGALDDGGVEVGWGAGGGSRAGGVRTPATTSR